MIKDAEEQVWLSPAVQAALGRAPAVFPDLRGQVRDDVPREELCELSFGVERHLRHSEWYAAFGDELFGVLNVDLDVGDEQMISALLLTDPKVRHVDQPDREFFEWVTDDRRAADVMLATFLDAAVTAFRAVAFRLEHHSPHLPQELGWAAHEAVRAARARPEWVAHAAARWDPPADATT